MNIKSLLFGSAAALVAVSGARAADAVVVAEPEPAEYVKICDVYGAGYFYIPGTETCLKIGGFVRYDASAGSQYNGYDGIWTTDKRDWARDWDRYERDYQAWLDSEQEGDAPVAPSAKYQGAWKKTLTAEVDVDTAQETEYGTLASHIAFRMYAGTGNGYGYYGDAEGSYFSYPTNGAYLQDAYIKLGGLLIGYTDSIFASWTNFAGDAINNSFVEYGDYANTNQINYTFDAGNGFSAIIGVEQGYSDSSTLDSYVPHVLAGAKFTQGWGGISVIGAYNSVWEEGSVKARLDVNVNEQFALFVMAGYGSDDSEKYGGFNDYKPWGGKWAVWGGGHYKASEKATIYAEASTDDDKNTAASLGVAYQLVPGFTIQPEVNYTRMGHWGVKENGDWEAKDGWGGIIRFKRSF